MKHRIEKNNIINETRISFFEKINKIDRTLARFDEEKK